MRVCASRSRPTWALACALAFVLAACQQIPRLPAPDASAALPTAASGRLAVRVQGDDQRSFTAQFELAGSPDEGRLSLQTPIGTQLALAQWQPGHAWLTADGDVREFKDIDALARQALGQPVPLAALFDWLAGRPWPAAPSTRWSAPRRGFEQLGWSVSLEGLDAGLLVATRQEPPVVTLRAKLDTPPAAAEQ